MKYTTPACPVCHSNEWTYKITEETKKNKIKNTWLCIKCDIEIHTETK